MSPVIDDTTMQRIREDAVRDARLDNVQGSIGEIREMVKDLLTRYEEQTSRLWGEIHSLRQEFRESSSVTPAQLEARLMEERAVYEERIRSWRLVIIAWLAGVVAAGTFVTWLLTSDVANALIVYKSNQMEQVR